MQNKKMMTEDNTEDYKISDDDVMNKFIKWLIDTDQPIDTWNHPTFRSFLETFAQRYTLTKQFVHHDRDFVRTKVLEKQSFVKSVIMEILENKKIAITTDCWTSGEIKITFKFINFHDELAFFILYDIIDFYYIIFIYLY